MDEHEKTEILWNTFQDEDWAHMRELIMSGYKDDLSDLDYDDWPMIFDLIWKGKEDLVILWLMQGYNPLVTGGKRHTGLLHAGACHGMDRLIKYILDLHDEWIHVDREDGDFNTPLYYAAKHGHTACVRVLLDHGASVDGLGEDEEFDPQRHYDTPLHAAANAEIADILLQAGAKMELTAYSHLEYERDRFGFYKEYLTPLTTAAMEGRMDVVRLLMERGMPLDHQPLRFMAMEEGVKPEHVREIIRLGADPNGEPGKEPLRIAASKGLTEICAALLEAGARPMKEALNLAILSNKEGCPELFLKQHIGDLPSATRIAAKAGDTILLWHLVDHAPVLAGQALHGAIEGCRFALAREIMEKHPESAAFRDAEGKTPLITLYGIDRRRSMYRFFRNDPDRYDAKWHFGAWYPEREEDFDAEDDKFHAFSMNRPQNWNKLLKVADDDVLSLAKELVDHAADVLARDKMGRSALWHACAMCYQKSFPWLLGAGLDINERDKGGKSCFDAGCLSGENLIIKPMVEAGAIVDAADGNGDTALLKCARDCKDEWAERHRNE